MCQPSNPYIGAIAWLSAALSCISAQTVRLGLG